MTDGNSILCSHKYIDQPVGWIRVGVSDAREFVSPNRDMYVLTKNW